MHYPKLMAGSLALFITGMTGWAITAGAAPERVPPIGNQEVKTECGDCHMAYQPRFLPAAAWRKIMAGLPDHFGEDASLDGDTSKRITDYLVKHAGRAASAGSGLRITELNWFTKEHEDEVTAKARKKAGTMANCTACHSGAGRGLYDDD